MIKIVYNINGRFDKYKNSLINIVNHNQVGKYDPIKDILLINPNIYTDNEEINFIFNQISLQYTHLQIEFKNK